MSEQDYFNKDFYAVLGVAKSASEEEIKKAYRKLSRKHRIAFNKGDTAAEERLKEVNEANAVIGNKDERQKYDQIRAMASGGARFSAGGGGFEDMFGGQSPYGGSRVKFSQGGFQSSGFGSGGLNDIFSSLFNGRGGAQGDPYAGGYGAPYSSQQAPSAPSAPPAIDKTYRIALKNAAFGAKLKHTFRDGSQATFKVPAGIASGKILGIKSSSGITERVKIEVKIPDATALTPEQQDQLKSALDLV